MSANPVDASDELGLLMRHDNGQLPTLRYSGSFPNAQVSIVSVGGGGGVGSSGSGRTNCGKHLNNNCNGGMNVEDDLESPLLQRQASLSVPPEEMLAHNKRWHSLEHMDGPGGHGNSVSYAADIENRQPGGRALDFLSGSSSSSQHRNRAGANSKLTNWMSNFFKGNGVRSGEARRVGILPSGMQGARTGFTDLAAAAASATRDRESIV